MSISWKAFLSLIGTVLSAGHLYSEPERPTLDQIQITKTVGQILNDRHVTQHRLNDEISRRLFKGFLEALDPQKLFFLDSDVRTLRAQFETELDDQVRAGELQFPYEVYRIYLLRLKERAIRVNEWVTLKHDYSLDESIDIDYENTPYSLTESEMVERWRKRIKYELLLLRTEERPLSQNDQEIKIVKRYRDRVLKAKEMTSSRLLEIYLSELSSSFDPHSEYLSAETLQNYQEANRLELEGIGITFRMEEGVALIVSIIPGSPAEKDGRLQVGDQIVAVGETEITLVDTDESSSSDIVKRIRGKKGTEVILKVISKEQVPKLVNLIRDKVVVVDGEAKGEIKEFGEIENGSSYKVGVIDLPSFYMDYDGYSRGNPNYKSASRDVRAILQSFGDKVDAVILDLRGNGGGAVVEAIEITGLFVGEDKPVFQSLNPTTIASVQFTEAPAEYLGPLMVLVDRYSASASEIVAAAIQDLKRGVVVGERRTHGKGSVQAFDPLSHNGSEGKGGGALKYTISQFYRINGQTTQNTGVIPDVVIASSLDKIGEMGESKLPYALKPSKISKVFYTPMDHIHGDMVSQLVQSATIRQNSSSELINMEELEDKKSISLRESKVKDEREKKKSKKKSNTRVILEKNPTNEEALNILEDYIGLLRENSVQNPVAAVK